MFVWFRLIKFGSHVTARYPWHSRSATCSVIRCSAIQAIRDVAAGEELIFTYGDKTALLALPALFCRRQKRPP